MTALGLALQVGAFAAGAPPASYDKSFAERYCVVMQAKPAIPADLPLEPDVVVRSPNGLSTARIVRSDGTKVPYDRAQAFISVETAFGEPIHCVSRGFRTVTVQWIGERFLFISKGIGRIVVIEEIYDVVARSWLVQQTVSYRVQ